MLRASATHTDRPAEPSAAAHDDVDPLVPGGAELLAFTTAALASAAHDDPTLVAARARLVAAVGDAGAARAATVAGSFEMMNRLLDASGVPVPPQMCDVGRDLGVID